MNDINRRSFITKMAAASAVSALAVHGLSSCKRSASNESLGLPVILDKAPEGKSLKAGLIGCGNRGTGAALNFLDAGNGLEIIALADVFQDKIDDCRKKLKSHNVLIEDKNCFTGFDGYKEILNMDVDVVLLATPPYFRPKQLSECVLAKKHVFMEKPASVDPVGARSVIASSKKAEAIGLTIITGTQRRHQEDYIETFKQIAGGAIGTIVSARAYWMQNHVWFRTREPGWNDLEYMLRNWNNYNWICGDHILDQHVHNIDIINWFLGKQPVSAVGFGGRARRLTGDQYDFFSIDYDYGGGVHSHSMSRQIDECANGIGEFIAGTEGYTNCLNTIYNLDGSIKWTYPYLKDASGKSTNQLKISPYVQEHIHLVTAIRTNKPVVHAEETAKSTLTAIMGREAAYTGKLVTWEDMMTSTMKLGPEKLEFGPVDMEFPVPVPGRQHKA